MIDFNKSYDYFINSLLKMLYAIYNRACFDRLSKANNSLISQEGWMSLKLSQSHHKNLDIILERILSRAKEVVESDSFGAHDITVVGNQPLSLNSLSTNDDLIKLREIVNQIIIQNEGIQNYLGINLERLNLEYTLLSNISSRTEANKRGSQNYHRDIYHSFYRGVKIFYPFNYSVAEQFGPFSFIPLSKIGCNETPTKQGYSKKTIKERRFDLHPVIKRNLHNSITLKDRELIALDTYNCFHAGGYVTAPDFIRLIFQVVISPPQTPNKFSDIASNHLSRFFYFSLIRFRNILRRSIR
jgi:hypothetical protein